MTAGCKSLINKFFPIDKSKGKGKQLAVAKQSCQVKLSGSNRTKYEAGQGAWGPWTKEVPLRELCGMGSPGTHCEEREWEVGELWCWWWMEAEDMGV